MTIIQRLRKHALPDPHDEREVLHAPLLREAADALESLSAQVAELKKALGRYSALARAARDLLEGFRRGKVGEELLEFSRTGLDNMNPYWLIERQKADGGAHWFSERRRFAQGDQDLWVEDVARAQRFKTKELAEQVIKDRFTNNGVFTPDDVYPVLPIATEHLDIDAAKERKAE